jgi:tetratricopeptide (TPR) repeat protein
LSAATAAFAQFPGLTLPASGKNQRATVKQAIGPVDVSIEYSGPAVHGPDGKDRRGEIWGKLVPYGMVNLGFGTAKESPWRAGANENTIFTASNDIVVQGKPLPAGRYGLHMIPGQDEWTIVFSKNSSAWGSFFYDPAQDALRVTTKPHKNDYHEWLTYEFTARRPTEATVELQWEDLAIPMTIQVANVNDIYVARLRDELTSDAGFSEQAFMAAAQFCVQENTHLDQGLEWADAAISRPFIGKKDFDTLSMKALVLAKMGRDTESDKVMQEALRLPDATPTEIHQYGRQLLAAKKNDQAMVVFKYNAERNGNAWPVHVGLARGYSALGDTKQALEHAQKALTQAPDDASRKTVEAMVKTLLEGKPISQ